jgi:hypothetical protein
VVENQNLVEKVSDWRFVLSGPSTHQTPALDHWTAAQGVPGNVSILQFQGDCAVFIGDHPYREFSSPKDWADSLGTYV